MTQFYTYCELEFLPVYVPTEEEKRNPKLFASNVRDVMAKYSSLPSTYTSRINLFVLFIGLCKFQ